MSDAFGAKTAGALRHGGALKAPDHACGEPAAGYGIGCADRVDKRPCLDRSRVARAGCVRACLRQDPSIAKPGAQRQDTLQEARQRSSALDQDRPLAAAIPAGRPARSTTTPATASSRAATSRSTSTTTSSRPTKSSTTSPRNTLTAAGNVILREPNGNVIRADRYTLTDDFRDGFVQSLSVVAKDDTRIAAAQATRREGNVTEFSDAKFTPCKSEGGMPPLWCISARRIIHDQQEATITYQDASSSCSASPSSICPTSSTPTRR